MFFAKFRNSLIGPSSPILLPRVSTQIDYEGELAVIIGTRCKEVSEQEALQYVAGYSIMNDVSARDIQLQTSQWTAGKALDTFGPMGPGMVLASDIPDPQPGNARSLVRRGKCSVSFTKEARLIGEVSLTQATPKEEMYVRGS